MKKVVNTIPFLSEKLVFPPVQEANSDGLLAVGGDLSPERLLCAYERGIFPWFNDDSLILWWSPDPRMVLLPDKLKVTSSMQAVLDSGRFSITKNLQFERVIKACATIPRKGQPGTWITPGMQAAYLDLHLRGIAKSYETWHNGKLVGGLYGIDLGHIFCGESMFHTESDASKFAFVKLVEDLKEAAYTLVDCQVYNTHLESLGAEEIPRAKFLEVLNGRKPEKS